jgi:xanthine dehydrogenase small subunit
LIHFILNDQQISTDLPPGMVLLDLIRYHQNLMGTKIGCREGDCGACTVLVGEIENGELKYESMTSCLMPIGNVQGKHIVTVEGINFPAELNPIQQVMADEGATQCGFCTPGFVMSMAGYCLQHDKEISCTTAVDGNICRCTGYKSIERAARKLEAIMSERENGDRIEFVTKKKILPSYFSKIKERLQKLNKAAISAASGKKPLGGGTDLYVQIHEEMVHAPIAFLFDPPSMNGIVKKGNKCVMGPSVTVTDLKNSAIINEAFPLFQRYAKLVSSTPIRNMATLAGNFVNASPIGDFTIFFLAMNAQIELSPGQSSNGDGKIRWIPLREFYKGYKELNKRPDELITKISFELPGPNNRFHFEKVSKRTHLDIASVNSAILLKIENNIIHTAGISAGGVAPVPLYLRKTSEFLKGKEVTDEIIRHAIELVQSEISPISDARGTKEYKRLLLSQLIKAHFMELLGNEEH